MQLIRVRYNVHIQMGSSRNEPVCVTGVLFLPSSFTGALYSPCGGPENHERQCCGLQVHYPLLGGGAHHCRLMGERYRLTHLR